MTNRLARSPARPRAVRQAAAASLTLTLLAGAPAQAADRLSLLDFAPPGTQVDRTGRADAAAALAGAVAAANVFTAEGEPACVWIPPGIYRISAPPPAFVRAGCVRGDGAGQSILKLDLAFAGDLFAWSEAWIVTTPGPRIVGLTVRGDRRAPAQQNAFVFYDRNDQVFMDDVDVTDLPGRALYSGATRATSQAYMRESHMRSLRFSNDGAPGVPVVEFSSAGEGQTDATNEIRMSQVDIYGPAGPGFVIRNAGNGAVRNITVEALRIEGRENGSTQADLMTIGDPMMRGNVNNIRLTDIELIDPYRKFAALRLTASLHTAAPYQITVSGQIGGGLPHGQGLRIDAGRMSAFHFSGINAEDTEIVIGERVAGILLEGAGQELTWRYHFDNSESVKQVHHPKIE